MTLPFSTFRVLRCAIIVFAICIMTMADKATWHHDRSPYRAVLSITGRPNHREAGVALTVPVCGLGREDGEDLVVYDQRGQQLPTLHLGPGLPNEVLALAEVRPGTEKVFAYFGSGMKAPSRPKGFLPGLTLEVRSLPEGPANNWKQVEALLEKSRFYGKTFVDKIEQTFNPANSADSCLLIFDGLIQIPKTGTHTFMIVTDDAGYLFINNELLIERNGRHYAADAARGEFKKEIKLDKGIYPIRFVVVDFGGDLMGLVAKWISGKNKYVLKPDDFVQPASTRVLEVEARYKDAPNPAFWSKQVSYMSYAGAYYTEVTLGTYNERPATWHFDDGARLEGKEITRIFPGLRTRRMLVSQKRTQAKAVLAFPETIPKQLSMKNENDFKRYSALILNQNLKDIDVGTLRGYIHFLNYHEYNEDVIPLCESIAANSKANQRERWDALLALGRAAARNFPEKSKEAYSALVKKAPGKDEGEAIAQEYGEFLLYRMRDFDGARELIETLSKILSGNSRTLLGLKLDTELQSGKDDLAREYLDGLLGKRDLGENQRFAAVKGNALRQRYYDLLASGFIQEARDVLNEWTDISPVDRANGSLALARAKMWQQLGWLDGALGELDGAILLDPLLPNLVDVELERGKVLSKAGDVKRANSAFMKIIEDYPNHPAAKEAKGLVK